MNEKDILFICDAHLGSGTNEPEKERRLLQFLDKLSPDRVSAVYILGDLFDFWFEYESVILSQYFKVLTKLAQVIEKGIEIHLVVGNHDYWAGDFLRDVIGMKIHYSPIEIKLDGRRVYMCHGDGLNPHDKGYLILKALIRNRFILWFVRWIHPDFLRRVARWFSRYSRNSTSVAGDLREDEGVRNFALKKLEEGFDIVVAGHSHQPHDEKHTINGQTRYYYNAGDMFERFSCVEYSGGKFQLKYMDGESNPR